MGGFVVAGLRRIGVLLYHLHLHRAVMWLSRRHPKVLLYHACDPVPAAATAGITSNTTPARFAADLEFLRRYYRVVPMSVLETGPVPDRAVAITFDDGFRSVYEHAYPLLRERGLPATVYVVTDVVGTERRIWVNELNELLRARPEAAAPVVAEALGVRARGLEDLVYAAVDGYEPVETGHLLAAVRAAAAPAGNGHGRTHLSWAEIAEMREHGIAIGNHTTDHPNLARLDRAAQRATIERARDVLRSRLGDVASLSYPFGHHDEWSREVALEAGHRSVLEVGGVNAPLDPSRIARIPVTARSDAELFADIEVVEPLKTWLKRQFGR